MQYDLIQGGKSHFMCELVKNREVLFEKNFDRIILCQHENLSYRNNLTFESFKLSFPQAELVSGLPNISKLGLDHSRGSASLVLIDDLQTEFLNSADMAKQHSLIRLRQRPYQSKFLGDLIAQWIAFSLETQRPRVRFSASRK